MTKLLSIFSIFFLSSCALGGLNNKAMNISSGDSKEKVIKIMGAPDNRQFAGNQEALQWCETGGMQDDFVAIFFQNSIVTSIQTYNNSGFGSCTGFFKRVDFKQ